MSIKKQAHIFQRQDLVYFTGTMTEVENQTQGGKPKKEILPPSGYQNFTPSSWTSKHILSSHNTIVLPNGNKYQNLLLIDWDLKDWVEYRESDIWDKPRSVRGIQRYGREVGGRDIYIYRNNGERRGTLDIQIRPR